MDLLCCTYDKPKKANLSHKEAAYALQARATGNYYNPQESNHLAFKESDLITVLEQHPSGMWKGYVSNDQNRVTGYFPSSMVVLVDSHSVTRPSCQLSGSAVKVSSPQVPDLIMRQQYHNSHQHLHVHQNGGPAYSSIGADESFPPPPSPLVTHKIDHRDPDRDSGISPQQSYPSHPFPGTQGYPGRQPSPNSPGERTAEWVGRYVVDGDARSHSPSSSKDGCSPGSSNRNSIASSTSSGGYLSPNYVNLQITQQHRLSGQSYESGVSGVSGISGVSSASRQSYHSTSSSSLGSLDRLEESGYSSTINVHELFQAGVSDEDVRRAWLADMHFDEYLHLFVKAGYDMPTISHMTPQDLSAIGITKPAHRKRLKAEISRLHIQDAIPDYKPSDVGEWLRLLNLFEYYPNLAKEGYHNIDDVTDITWEDLEEVGIQRLGHQKKIMLAIDRLRRIQTGERRLSHLDRKGSQEMLEPASSYPTPLRWPSEKGTAGPPPVTPVKVVRSASGENLCGASTPELRSFAQQQAMQNGPTDFLHLHGSKSNKSGGRYQPDVVAIQVSKTPNARGSTVPDDMVEEEVSSTQHTYQSFYSPITRSCDRLDGDVTPTNEMGGLSGDETDGCSTLKKTAMVSPRVKPKPIIMAKTKRMSRELPADFLKPESFDTSGSIAYSTATLPRKSSKKKLERIYDQPSSTDFITPFESYLQQSANRNSAPSSPAHSANLHNSSPRTKKAPPPPPKRTNSMKSESGFGRFAFRREREEHPVFTSQNSSPAAVAAPSAATAPATAAPAPVAAANVPSQPAFSSCVASLADRFKKPETTTGLGAQTSQTHSLEEFPPPPPPLDVSGQQAYTDYNGLSSGNALSDVIEQLEHASHKQQHTQQQQQQPQQQQLPPQQQQNGTKPKQKGTDGKTETATPTVRRNESSSSLESTASASSLESNTLPFANENVGTIKQRNPSSKASILTVCMDGDADGDKSVDLNASLFDDHDDEEETGTMKRNPKATQPPAQSLNNGSAKKAPPPTPKRRDSNSGSSHQGSDARAAAATVAAAAAARPAGKDGEPGDVLNDIGNMLQDLTDELDAMLELELPE